MAFVAEVGQVIASLNPALQVEAAETVTDQKKAEWHGSVTGRGHRMGQGPLEDNQLS